jgi:HJR/Mrr/RecB family endonuclease
MVASLAVISAAFTFLKLRASQEETSSKMSEISNYRQFENQVARVIKKSAARSVETGTYSDRSFDFMVDLNGKRIGIEAKSWTGRHLPKVLVDVALKRIEAARTRTDADEAILVTQANLSPLARVEGPKLKVMSLRELEGYLR